EVPAAQVASQSASPASVNTAAPQGQTPVSESAASQVAVTSGATNASPGSSQATPRSTRPAQARAAAEPPPPPRFVVVAQGDSAPALPAQRRLEAYLPGAGHRLVDAATVPGLSGGGTASRIRAARRHARVVVIVRTEPIGSRDLHFYGRHDVAYTAYLSVRA